VYSMGEWYFARLVGRGPLYVYYVTPYELDVLGHVLLLRLLNSQ